MREDDGLTWEQCVSLAETVLGALSELWQMMPDISEDEMQGSYLEAETHLTRLLKRARVMRDREAGGDA